MRQAFNNPWVVLALSVFAVIILYLNAEEVSMNPSPTSKANPVPSAQSPKVQKLEVSDSPIALIGLTWPETVTRDPFAPVAATRSKGQGEVGESTNRGSESGTLTDRVVGPLPSLQLSAITLEPNPKLAVINRTIVEEGELIEGLQVSKIEADGVWLNGPSGSHHVGFEANKGKHPSNSKRDKSSSNPSNKEDRESMRDT